MKIEQILIWFSSTKFNEILFSDSNIVLCVQLDCWTD